MAPAGRDRRTQGRFARDALQELAKGEVLGGDQTDAKAMRRYPPMAVARLRAKASWS